MYNSLNVLGLSNGATVNQVLTAMPNNSIFCMYCVDKTVVADLPILQAVLSIIKSGSNAHLVEVTSIWGSSKYIAAYNGNNAINGWYKYTGTKVE